jgi:hypothetical protein
MNARTHTLPTGSIDKSFKAVPAPDLMAIIDRTAPGKEGLSILYSLAGGLDMRVAKLAAMITSTMAGIVRMGSEEFPAVDKYNDAMNALDEVKVREWSFDQAGITQRDMVNDLRDLLGFRLTVTDHLTAVSGKPFAARWMETIERAGTPQAVEDWKLEFSWMEYLEGCHGKPEMTEAEFKQVESVNLAGTKQNWSQYLHQIVETIDRLQGDAINFDDMSPDLQKRILQSICSEDKEARFRTGALKLSRNPAELHTRRAFISSFCCAAREALTHARYAERGVDAASLEAHDQAEFQALALRVQNGKLTSAAEAEANKDVFDLVSDEL